MGLRQWLEKRKHRKRLRASYPRVNEKIDWLKLKLDEATKKHHGDHRLVRCPWCGSPNENVLDVRVPAFQNPIVENLCRECRRPVLYVSKWLGSAGHLGGVVEVVAHATPRNGFQL
jgi:hypothetical protein